MLEARESLHQLHLLAISQGALDKHVAEQFIQTLTEQAYPDRLETQRTNVSPRPSSTRDMQALVGNFSVKVTEDAGGDD